MSDEASPKVTNTEQERLSLFINSIVDYAILSLDVDGRVVTWNTGAERLKGYTAAEIIGEHFSRFYPEADRERGLPEHLLGLARANGTVEHTGWRVRKDGTYFWGDIVISAVRDETGTLVGYTKITRDLTEHKKAEDREHALNESLERANELKSEFLATMSHEVRTPLNGIIGMLTLLENSDLSPVQRDQVRAASSSSHSLLRIVNDILDFSRVEAGKLELEERPFVIGHLISELEALFIPQAQSRALRFVTNVQPDLPPVVGDAGRLRQILANLLGNSIKFTTSGTISCAVREVNRSDERITLRVEVTDTGIGLNEEGRERLFEPFAQADLSTTRRYGGTGLGLAICRRLLNLMGSELRLHSVEGEGSTFWFNLDLGVSTEATPDLVEPSIKPDLLEASALSGTILVAEDNPVNQQVMVAFLNALGCDAVVATNGAEALEVLQSHPVDLVLMDCQMPVMDGFEATRQIRNLEGPLSAVPIIAVTASALPRERDMCFAAGMNDFLAKPVLPSTLTAVLEPYLRKDDQTSTAGTGQSYLAMLKETMGEHLPELVAKFVESTTKQLDDLEAAMDRNDAAGGRLVAHTLKGSSAVMGAVALSDAALKMEKALANEEVEEARLLLGPARKAFEAARAEFETEGYI